MRPGQRATRCVQKTVPDTTPHWGWQGCPPGTLTQMGTACDTPRQLRLDAPALSGGRCATWDSLSASCECDWHRVQGRRRQAVGRVLTPRMSWAHACPSRVLRLACPSLGSHSSACCISVGSRPSSWNPAPETVAAGRPVLAVGVAAVLVRGCHPECCGRSGAASVSTEQRLVGHGQARACPGEPTSCLRGCSVGWGPLLPRHPVSYLLVPIQIFCPFFTRVVFFRSSERSSHFVNTGPVSGV